jgi:signal transduction histidine kinase
MVKARVRYFGQVVVVAAFGLFILLVSGDFEAAFAVIGMFGIWLAYRGYHLIYAPALERRWMAAELEWRLARIQAERGEDQRRESRSLEELSASIAHEIRNPITAARSLVQQMGEDPSRPENVEYAKIALDELARVERSVAHLLRYARAEACAPEQLKLSDVVASALVALEDRVEAEGVAIVQDHDPAIELRGDPEQLRRVVLNLVTNALDALRDAKTPAPTITIASGANLAGDAAWLKVRDNGPGVPPEEREKVFSPFHTSKVDGTGLGLAIVKKLVAQHGGTIELASEVGRFTELTVTLPRAAAKGDV